MRRSLEAHCCRYLWILAELSNNNFISLALLADLINNNSQEIKKRYHLDNLVPNKFIRANKVVEYLDSALNILELVGFVKLHSDNIAKRPLFIELTKKGEEFLHRSKIEEIFEVA